MAKRRQKKRTHVRTDDKNAGSGHKSPKSMVIRMGAGEVGSSVSQLVKDIRLMMEPDTASRLRERKSNKLKDYLSMSGPLGVTHLLLFSRSPAGNTNMRIALTPRGPTLNFHVEKYSLCKDIAKAQKHPRTGGKEYINAPLLVMNNFTTQTPTDGTSDPIRKQLESLTTTIFQSMFPPISPQNTPLSSIRRIMLVNREPSKDGSWLLSLRHYAIITKRTGPSKRIRRLDPKEQRQRERKGKAIPNLGKLEDAADYLLDPAAAGYTSASETELDTDNEVEVLETTTRKVLSKKEMQRQREKGPDATPRTHSSSVEKRAVKLVELGPRLRLRMYKVEEGVCEGRIMWHDIVSKSKQETKELDSRWETKRKEKEERRRIQKENVERKKKEKEEARKNGKGVPGDGEDQDDDEDEEMSDDDAWDSEDFDHEAEIEEDGQEEDEEQEEEEEMEE